MSDLKRIERIAKSLIPRFPKGNKRQYTLSEAHLMITDMGMDISPESLAKLVNDDLILDDFLNCIYNVENSIKKRIVNEMGTIDAAYEPKAYEDENLVAFTFTYKGKERVFAEYEV